MSPKMLPDMFYERFFGNTILEYSMALAVLLFFAMLARIFYYLSNYYLKRYAEKTSTKYDYLIIDALDDPAVMIIFNFGLLFCVNLLSIPATYRNFVQSSVTALFIIAGSWALVRLIDILVKEYLGSVTKKTKTKLDEQLLPVMRKGLKLMVFTIAVLVIISNFGVDISALLAGLGIGGIALALAAKDTVENLFGALAIFLDKPFTIGDRVVVDGVTGDVMEVGLRSTRIKTLDNTELYIPNSRVMTSNIENISRPNRSIAYSATINLTYSTSPEKMLEAKRIVRQIIENTEGVSDKYEPIVVFSAFGSSSIDISMKFWIGEYRQKRKVCDRVNQRILEEFNSAKLDFAYPTQTLYVKK